MFPYKIIDLTHAITPDIPLWPGSDQFKMPIKYGYRDVGCRVVSYSMVAATGTHLDAPAHFFHDGKTVDRIPVKDLIAPLCIIDVRDNVANNHDYVLQISDIDAWEAKHGIIAPSSVIVMHTGWSDRWNNPQSYINSDSDDKKHFPGFGIEAAQRLLERKVVGIGIDTFSLDAGLATHFPVHKRMLGDGIYFLENLTNLQSVPECGAFICALPLKIANAPEVPLRVVAFVP